MASTIATKCNIQDVLQLLIQRKKLKSGSELAKKLNLPAPTVNRILSGQVIDPRASTLSLIADYFHVTIDQLVGKEALPNHLYQTPDELLRPSMAIPVINQSTTNLQTALNAATDWFRWSTDSPTKRKKVFAIKLNNHHLEPVFQKGTLLVIDPEMPAQNHDYVAVQYEKDNMITIKKFIIDGRDQYFYPLQKGHKIYALSDIKHKIYGTVIEAHIDLTEFR